MPSFRNRLFFILILMIFTAGCASKGVTFRSYIQDKKRVDLGAEGKLGNWENSPDIEYAGPPKETRQMFIFEFTQDAMDNDAYDELLKYEPPPRRETNIQQRRSRTSPPPNPQYDIPTFDDDEDWIVDETPPADAGTYVQYTVEKNDTLQKISNKFFNTYRKWPKIYEANKDQIKDPNFIKPGITIRIPMDQ